MIIEEFRIPIETVRPLALELIEWLSPHAERIECAGSVRRGKDMVKDVELVVLNPLPSYHAELNAAVERGLVSKKLYGDKRLTRWGERYKGIVYQGVTFELFTCDDDNAGYIQWLRTGPGEANQYLVTQLKYHCKAWCVDKGYLWTRNEWDNPEQKLHVPTEAEFFALCGVGFIEPGQRSEQAYRKLFGKGHAWGNPTPKVAREEAAVIQQDSMFDMPEPVAQDTPVVAHTLHDYNAAWYPAWYEGKAAQAEAAGMAQAAAYYRMRADECRKAWEG